MKCATPHCQREAIPAGRWCHECTVIVWRTGREPEPPRVFVPEWRKRLTARDETGRAA